MSHLTDIRLACVEDGLDNTGFRKIAAFIKKINPNTKVAYVPTANHRNLVGVLMEKAGGNLNKNDIEKAIYYNQLAENDINAAYHYPIPCHLQKAYSYLGHKKGDFPKSEYLAFHCVSLPMYAELTDSQVAKVIRIVNLY